MLELICECNQAATLKGLDKIFKITDKMLEGFARLPFTTVTDKERLTYVVGMLTACSTKVQALIACVQRQLLTF